ncbi:hypothetical protein [Shewanella sp. MEBiC00475]|uniref:hypothetical protein n=1 Tax=Shewanella sp. MEBiC00475 TaxID=2575361 RepID=UPI0010BF8F9D|nr:hypothetical protein [Shewanella sp. MEBiC00475]
MKLSLLLICGAVCYPVMAANKLPPILDFYPECTPQVINTASDRVVYDIDLALLKQTNSSVMAHSEAYLQQALVGIQHKAELAGADAVIIDRLNVGSVDRSVDLKDDNGRVNSNVKQIIVLSTVQHIKLCEDQQLTKNPTPYNSKGKSLSFTETLVTLAMPEKEDLLIQAQKHNAPKADITTNSAYGVHIGDTLDELQQALGPHSIQLQFRDGTMVYGYGRSLWFFVENAKIAMISQEQGMLNGHGKNQITLSENYDHDDWVIVGKVHQGDELQTVAKHLSLRKNNGYYTVKGESSQLILQFEDYKESITKEAVSKLNNFSIMPIATSKKNHQVNFANFDNIDIAKIIALDDKQAHTLQPQQLINQIQLSENGPMVFVNNNVLLGINDQGTVNRIKVTESMLASQDINEFNKVLANYQIPATKSALLVRYPNAEDNFDNVMISEGNLLMSVNFDSYDDDAQLIDLTLSF